jgi:hypothetical protein
MLPLTVLGSVRIACARWIAGRGSTEFGGRRAWFALENEDSADARGFLRRMHDDEVIVAQNLSEELL